MSSVRTGWSKDKNDWKRLALCIEKNNIKWKLLKNFSAGSLIQIPDSSGLYMLCSMPPENKTTNLSSLFTPLYIGQSVHLKTRLLQHIRSPQDSIIDVYSMTSTIEVLYTKCNIENLAELENCLIRAFGPVTNKYNAIGKATEVEPIKARLGKLEKIKTIGD